MPASSQRATLEADKSKLFSAAARCSRAARNRVGSNGPAVGAGAPPPLSRSESMGCRTVRPAVGRGHQAVEIAAAIPSGLFEGLGGGSQIVRSQVSRRPRDRMSLSSGRLDIAGGHRRPQIIQGLDLPVGETDQHLAQAVEAQAQALERVGHVDPFKHRRGALNRNRRRRGGGALARGGSRQPAPKRLQASPVQRQPAW